MDYAESAFAQNRRPGELVEGVAAAMILFLRPHLMGCSDMGTALRRLQKFPPVEDVRVLLERGRAVLPCVAAVGRRGPAQSASEEDLRLPGAGAGLARREPLASRLT